MMFSHFNTLTLSLMTLLIVSCGPTASGTKAENPDYSETPIEGAEDPLASESWHLQNTGQKTFSSAAGTAGEDMDIKEVHDLGIKGAGVTIAISDTGIDIDHSDLSGNQLSSAHRSYTSEDPADWRNGDPRPIEKEAHGTGVTGLIAALGWNGIGSRGVAPSANYAGFLFVGSFHDSDTSYEAKILDQMTGDFDIFNYSYGLAGCSFEPTASEVIDAYKYGVTNLRSGKGALYVKAAGNEYIGYNSACITGDNTTFLGNTNTSEEHNHPYVLLTGAVNAKGKIATYSTPGSGLWIAAAGGESGKENPAMLTTDLRSCSSGYSSSASSVTGFNKGSSTLNPYCNYTSIMNGTSSSTPVVSGIIALMLEANPDLSWRDVKHILAETADKINYSTGALAHPAGSSSVPTGHVYDYLYVRNNAGYDFSNTYGFGRVNANQAVQMAQTYVSNLGTYQESSWYASPTLALAIPDNSAAGVTDNLNVAVNYFIESVQIKISTNHTYVGDLGVELVSPAGTTSKLLLVNSNIKHSGLSEFTLLSNAFYGESSAGNWTIKIIDGADADTGTFTSWKIKVNGH